MSAPTALTMACTACGAGIPLDRLVPSVRCGHCGHLQEVPYQRRAELARYQGDVGQALDRAAQEHAQASQWNAMSTGEPPRWMTRLRLLAVVLFFPALLAPAVLQVIAPAVGIDPLDTMSMGVQLVESAIILGLFLTAVVLTMVGRTYTRRSAPSAATGTLATCPRCGGSNALGLGCVLERCAHCGATLMPSRTVMADAFAAAANVHHRAELQRYRAERAGMLGLLSMSGAPVVPYLVCGSFGMMLLLITVSMTFDVVRGHSLSSGPNSVGDGTALLYMWLMVGALAVTMAGIHRRRRSLREHAAGVAEAASGPFARRPIENLAGMVAWLDANWAGPTPVMEISAGPCFAGAAMVIDQFMGAVAVSPLPFGRGYPGYVRVHLAAWVPCLHGAAPFDRRVVRAQEQALLNLGFQLSMEPAGLRALADQRVARRLVRRADGGATLASVTMTLVEIAKMLGGVPQPT